MPRKKAEEKKVKKKDESNDTKLDLELKKLGKAKVYVDTEDDPDDFKEYPLIVVCKHEPREYIYPIMIKLENSNIIRLTAMNNYISTVLRICELFNWCIDIRLKRKRQMEHIVSKKTLIVNEYILEKIPACRR